MIYICSDDRAYDDLCSFVNHAVELLDAYRFLTNSFIPVNANFLLKLALSDSSLGPDFPGLSLALTHRRLRGNLEAVLEHLTDLRDELCY